VIIDSHTHIGLESFLQEDIPAEKRSRPAFQDPLENSIAQLIACMDANAVDRAITFGYPLKEIDRVQANAYVLTAYQAHPDRIIPFMLAGDDTGYWLKRGAMGFKQQNILYAPERFNLIRAYQVMAEAGVPMLIHFRAGQGYDVAAQVRAILAEVPTLKLIVAHMGRHTPNTSDRVESAVQGLRNFPNVVFETSTVRDSAAIARAVDIVGPDRIIFGSDYPFNSYQDRDPLAEELAVIERTGLTGSIKQQILGTNISAFMGLAEAR
jgi:predicted TIM-barrel fold metal-dependent hydrolase